MLGKKLPSEKQLKILIDLVRNEKNILIRNLNDFECLASHLPYIFEKNNNSEFFTGKFYILESGFEGYGSNFIVLGKIKNSFVLTVPESNPMRKIYDIINPSSKIELEN